MKRISRIAMLFLVFSFSCAMLQHVPDAIASTLRACPASKADVDPLLARADKDSDNLIKKINSVNDKYKAQIILCDYLKGMFEDNGYSLPKTINGVIVGMYETGGYHTFYSRSGLQSLIDPVMRLISTEEGKADAVKRGYVLQETVEYIHKMDAIISKAQGK